MFEASVVTGTARPEVPSLTGLRFYAAWLVVLSHTALYLFENPNAGFGRAWSLCAYLGMTLFFVLSGFVIHYNYGIVLQGLKLSAIKLFLVARFARLYPLYVFVFVIGVWMFPQSYFSIDFLTVLPLFATLSQNWAPIYQNGVLISDSYFGLAWSISAEVLLYVFYLAIVGFASRISKGVAVTAMVILAGVATIFFAGRTTGWWLGNVESPRFWFYLSPYCRVPEFMLGVFAAQFYLRSREVSASTGVGLILAGMALIAAVFATIDTRFSPLIECWGFAPGVALVMLGFSLSKTVFSAIAESRLILVLGEASYSIYFLHGLMFAAMGFRQGTADLPSVLLCWAAICVASLTTYWLVEAPARRAIRAMAQPRRTSLRPS